MTTEYAAKKTVCKLNRADFKAKAHQLPCTIDGQAVTLLPKDFKTGSYGFYANGKISLDVGGVTVQFQMGVTLTAVGSKDMPAIDAAS